MQDQLDSLTNLEKKIYRESEGRVFIGGEEVKPEILSLLKEQARYIESSQFWEVLHATLINESVRAAWESKNWDAVQYSKALKYTDTIIRNMIRGLTK